ncbi:MAG: hypothetical protein EHM57_02615 [Actinobacteria bacterium]|nr:MAG: hypothetical protein EHM57_02615 [Actinomycetota bacterium]
MDPIVELIESSDLAGLTKHVDRAAAAGDWEGLVDLIESCAEAVTRGKQVWAVAQFAEYRLALQAPAHYAGAVVGDARAGIALGPLWEVAASRHTWAELSLHLGEPRSRALAAHERVLRGDMVDPADVGEQPLDVPLRLEPWEPAYPLAVYRGDGADFPEPGASPLEWVDLPPAGERLADDSLCDALMELVRPWWEESSGRAVVAAVDGGALSAVRSLGPHRARVARVTPAEALAAMAWAGASGGAYGRRRGTPVGRASAWWVLAEALGYGEPPDDPGWGAEADELEWWRWDPGDQIGGWAIHMAIHDPSVGTSWALSAVDMK